MRTKVRFWRWRRNELKRRSDIAETWTRVAAGTLLVIGAPLAGAATATAVDEATLHQHSDWHQASAVLTEDAPTGANALPAEHGHVRATIRWKDPDGTTHTGRALVTPAADAGTRTTIWLDDSGALHDAPPTPGEAAAQGAVFGGAAAGITCLFALGGRRIVQWRLDRSRAAAWEREWAAIGPEWGHHHA
ncbi:hypothetical protein ACFYMW_03290 [Streptomyces sp. NPDC006692]|uniref:Rv1733c family protein n=1 Tax=unclassified Streptomyces TaxID=2593676 RepID=UPI0036929501